MPASQSHTRSGSEAASRGQHHGGERDSPPYQASQRTTTDQKNTGPPARESTSDLKRRQEKEKNEKTFQTWLEVKAEAREEETRRLKQRINLQHELIHAQDQQYQHRLQDQEQARVQKQNEEKAEKRAKNDALLQVCLDSLQEDQKALQEKRAKTKPKKPSEERPPSLDTAALLADDPDLADPDHKYPDTAHSSLASAALDLPTRPSEGAPEGCGFETLREEEDEEEGGDVFEDNVHEEELPWHHVQLYRLYGHDADYFLHPKIEVEQKTHVSLNPRMRAVGGRAGAGTLWTLLRTESRARILRQDNKLLSPELKSTFGAFAREGLANKKKVVTRNYSSTDDVPDMSRLLDQSRLYNAQDFRHRVELMYRSSVINQDRTKVLMLNNPPPDLNNHEGSESVQRYMPSWAPENWDEETELSYKKWLRQRPDSDLPAIEYPDSSRQPSSSPPRSSDPSTHQRSPRQRSPRQRYFFLTEQAATCEGEFTKRRKELAEAKTVPAAHKEGPYQKSHSAMAALGGGGGSVSIMSPRHSSVHTSGTKQTSTSSVRAASEMSRPMHRSAYQPLTLSALMEYKTQQNVLGEGNFNQGQAPVWKREKPTAAT